MKNKKRKQREKLGYATTTEGNIYTNSQYNDFKIFFL